MMIFWILAAGLATLALVFILVPLLRRQGEAADADINALNLDVFRQQIQELDADLALGKLDQTQYEAARHDLERELIHDLAPAAEAQPPAGSAGRWAAALLALAVPAGAVTLYLAIGNLAIIPKLEAATNMPPAQAAAGHAGATLPDGSPMPPLSVLADQLAERMEQKPDNVTGWLMLARTRATLGQKDKAMAALERAFKVAPRDPAVLLAYAEALAEANGSKLTGRPQTLLDTLLEVEPASPNGLWLRGLAAFQSKDYAGALSRWEPLLALLDPNGQDATELTGIMNQARAQTGLPPLETVARQAPVVPMPTPSAPTSTQSSAQQSPTAAGLTVSVALDPALAAQVPQAATVFVYAKAVSGPPMPLAAKRVRVSDLPITLTLDDSMAMMPQMRLSAFPQVTVGARISRSGQAMPQSGDLEGEVSPVASNQADPVAVTISRVRP
jgi:cytochrome c-type biogenesis protein CcmH